MNRTELLIEAEQVRDRAHAPYSGYRVGAALLCADGSVFTGCNVENASFGLTICAERSALFSAVAAGRKHFTAMAISASGEPKPYPCGACRQVLAEFCSPDFTLLIAGMKGHQTLTLGELLPHGFTMEAPRERS